MALSRKHQYFIYKYTTPKQSGFLNATESYKLTYPDTSEKAAESNSVRLMKIDHIKIGIDKGLEPIHNLSKGGYVDKLEEELKNCKAPATRARLLELIGRVHSLLRDREVNTTVNTINIKDLRNVLDERQSMLEPDTRRITPEDEPNESQ
ncbi:MAG: hypothetical protein ACXQTI_01895 [Candidatus Nezhaarchaeales archaeon]